MNVFRERFPASLKPVEESLVRCLEAFARVRKIHAVYLFGSHARGEAGQGSDVDLCIVSEDAERQFDAARAFREAIWDVWPCPALTLIPVTPERLAEKRESGDHFFRTVLSEGVLIAA